MHQEGEGPAGGRRIDYGGEKKGETQDYGDALADILVECAQGYQQNPEHRAHEDHDQDDGQCRQGAPTHIQVEIYERPAGYQPLHSEIEQRLPDAGEDGRFPWHVDLDHYGGAGFKLLQRHGYAFGEHLPEQGADHDVDRIGDVGLGDIEYLAFVQKDEDQGGDDGGHHYPDHAEN